MYIRDVHIINVISPIFHFDRVKKGCFTAIQCVTAFKVTIAFLTDSLPSYLSTQFHTLQLACKLTCWLLLPRSQQLGIIQKKIWIPSNSNNFFAASDNRCLGTFLLFELRLIKIFTLSEISKDYKSNMLVIILNPNILRFDELLFIL